MSTIGSLSGMLQRPEAYGVSSRRVAETTQPGIETSKVEKPAGTAPSFGSVLDKLVGDVDAKLKSAQLEQSKVLGGESTNLHQAVIAMQEGSLAFSLMVEVRNKMVESYQELMRMQV